MDRRPMLIRNIILDMLLDTCRRRPTMPPIRTPTGNMGMDGGMRSMKSAKGMRIIRTTTGTGIITTTISSDRRVGREIVAI